MHKGAAKDGALGVIVGCNKDETNSIRESGKGQFVTNLINSKT